ncbi:Thioesterase/thiol ester dehydrase-isomerase [Melanomma pulvis-pyrius CBS 109.77]|uniref:Thioesterase/thiol ester dehydrase-isomerase n=1 Tax=Melanomma pulvis-pyrius CBS 109.77 TaxID=1314802 RepID=A0A6A6X639_9PLEO|nr:Thioesterase/thiol ester dehydrase-isomerase [Melanomma pulvis-pyrius CBS 109.77]
MYPVARSAFCRSVGPLALRTKISPLPRAARWGIKDTAGLRPQVRWRNSKAHSGFDKAEREVVDSALPIANSIPRNVPPRRAYLRYTLVVGLTIVAFTLGFTMAAAPALPAARDFLSPPTDEETLTNQHFTPSTPEVAEIERQIFSHPLTRSLLQDPNYIASRPHLKIPHKLRAHNLTGGTLQGPDKIAVPPLQFTTEDGSTYVSLQYLGPALCGHPGVVHGGLLATLLDEGLARCCFPALPNKVAVTASLKIDYKKPVMAGQIVVLRAETTRVEGRKAWVTGRLTTLPKEGEEGEGTVLTEGEALFIEPRHAAAMKRVVN